MKTCDGMINFSCPLWLLVDMMVLHPILCGIRNIKKSEIEIVNKTLSSHCPLSFVPDEQVSAV